MSPVSTLFPDILERFYEVNSFHGAWFVSEPTGKTPVKYWAVPVTEETSEEDGDGEFLKHVAHIMPSGTLVLQITASNYKYMDEFGGLCEHVKFRVVRNLDDLWSCAQKPYEVGALKRFLNKCGELLNNDPTMFYKIIEDEPVPF